MITNPPERSRILKELEDDGSITREQLSQKLETSLGTLSNIDISEPFMPTAQKSDEKPYSL